MMKITHIILLIILLIPILSDQCDKFTGSPTKADDCFNQLSDQQRKDLKKTHCCFFQSDDQINSKCISLTDIQYDNIDDYIEYNEILWGYVNVRINCKSFYYKFGIFYVILFLLVIVG